MRTSNRDSASAGGTVKAYSAVRPRPSLKKKSGRLIGFIRSVAIEPSRMRT